tara:strand:+ start:7227 stop:7373 length:147 start_codon:yes stop_codon:yes gene_type:complete
MIIAYFETTSTSEEVGRYLNEEAYMNDLPRLEALAKEWRGFITESVQI